MDISEEASRTGHLEWVKDKLTGDNGANFFHIKRQSRCNVQLKKSSAGSGSDQSILHFNLKAKSEDAMVEGLRLVRDLIGTVTRAYQKKVRPLGSS